MLEVVRDRVKLNVYLYNIRIFVVSNYFTIFKGKCTSCLGFYYRNAIADTFNKYSTYLFSKFYLLIKVFIYCSRDNFSSSDLI